MTMFLFGFGAGTLFGFLIAALIAANDERNDNHGN